MSIREISVCVNPRPLDGIVPILFVKKIHLNCIVNTSITTQTLKNIFNIII